jgi:hypothetical protein
VVKSNLPEGFEVDKVTVREVTPHLREDFLIVDQVISEMRTLLTDPQYVEEVLTEMRELMVKKGQDYSGNAHTWANFEEAAGVSAQTPEAIFLALLGTKFARWCALVLEAKPFTPPIKGWKGNLQNWIHHLQPGRKPNNESLADTLMDLANYQVLFIGYMRWRKGQIGGQE